MPDGLSKTSLTPYAVLHPGVTWRAVDEAGRDMVLKKLPDDCLRGGRLHPAIALRLTRLREAPVNSLAQLIGVQMSEAGVVIVSEFIPGRSIDELTPAQRRPHLATARRLVESLHRAGLVHGAIGPGNFILSDGGRVMLVDPSPFLYDDPDEDLAALARLDPDEPAAEFINKNAGLHVPTLAAAAGLVLVAVAGAAAWAMHVAGGS